MKTRSIKPSRKLCGGDVLYIVSTVIESFDEGCGIALRAAANDAAFEMGKIVALRPA